MILLRHHQLLMSSSATPPPPGVPPGAISLIEPSIGWEQYVFPAAAMGTISYADWTVSGAGLQCVRVPNAGGGTTIRFQTTGPITGIVTLGRTIYTYFGGYEGNGSSGIGSGTLLVSTATSGGAAIQNLTTTGSGFTRAYGSPLLQSAVINNVTGLAKIIVTLSMSSSSSNFTSLNPVLYIGIV